MLSQLQGLLSKRLFDIVPHLGKCHVNRKKKNDTHGWVLIIRQDQGENRYVSKSYSGLGCVMMQERKLIVSASQ